MADNIVATLDVVPVDAAMGVDVFVVVAPDSFGGLGVDLAFGTLGLWGGIQRPSFVCRRTFNRGKITLAAFFMAAASLSFRDKSFTGSTVEPKDGNDAENDDAKDGTVPLDVPRP